MGTSVNLTVVGEDLERCEAAVDATFERMARLESQLSRCIPDSHLSRLNAHWFTNLPDGRKTIEAWRQDYNGERPHVPGRRRV